MRRLLLGLTTFTACCVAAAPAHAAWQWPVSGDVITPYRNGTDPYATGQHRGIDIGAPVGTAVRAAAGGEVRFAGTAGSSGLTISIRTGDGYDTSYLHLSSLDVRSGAHISAGDRIGTVGTTGSRSAAAPHLHFGVRDAGTRHAYHDPLAFLPPPAVSPRSPTPPPAAAPAPAPPPPAAAPAPIPERVPTGRRAPEPAPRGVPEPAPAPHAAPRQAPRAGTAPEQAPTGALRRTPAPIAPAQPVVTPNGAPRDVRGTGDGRRGPAIDPTPPRARVAVDRPQMAAGSEHRAEATTSTSRPAGEAPSSSGPDIGWALACAGLLLAAGILGLTHDGRDDRGRNRSRRSGEHRSRALLPLVGRR